MLIEAPYLTGSGTIKANGGSGNAGGGRISVKLTNEYELDGSPTLQVQGTGTGNPGQVKCMLTFYDGNFVSIEGEGEQRGVYAFVTMCYTFLKLERAQKLYTKTGKKIILLLILVCAE